MNRTFSKFKKSILIVMLLMIGFNYAMSADVVLTKPRLKTPERYILPTIIDGSLAPAKTTEQVASVLQTVVLLTFLTLAPSILILTTCFTRIVIVLGFLRRALATQSLPPDQVLVGISLFLTIFIMAPTWSMAWKDGIKPYLDGNISPETGEVLTQEEAFERILAPQRRFMFACLESNKGTEEIIFFMGTAGYKKGTTYIGRNGRTISSVDEIMLDDISTLVLIPAFITAELKRSFWMGFYLYLPFLILDMVIASVLMSMGMMMLPPVMISLPFKIILFVLVDGWRLVMEGIVSSFPLELTNFADAFLSG